MYCYSCGICHLQNVKEVQPLWHFKIGNHFYWVFSITPVFFGFLVPCGVPDGGLRGTVSCPPFCNYQYSASLSAPLNHSPRPPWWTCSPRSATPKETFWNHHRVPPMWFSAPSAWFAYFPPFICLVLLCTNSSWLHSGLRFHVSSHLFSLPLPSQLQCSVSPAQ